MKTEWKDIEEIVTLTFPFTEELAGATISAGTPVLAIEVEEGVDPNYATVLMGGAQISGGDVLQLARNGVDGAAYHVRCRVDLSDGRRLVRSLTLPVRRI
ncbi:MAG: hypothetical protein IT529_06165 [Burkholderiales bacterium]|nr:hypothetical protein [Burkholderiales bacterium]